MLLSDIGSTNARFALLRDGQIGPVDTLAVRETPSVIDAIRGFVSRHPPGVRIARALLGVAGPIEGDRCTLTNSAWHINGAELRAEFGFGQVDLVNDFAALAWSLPRLSPGDLQQIGHGAPRAGAPSIVVGPGTGLGLAGFVPSAHGGIVLEGEGGHVTLAGGDLREDIILGSLRDRFGHASAERVLSGPGLVNLYHAIAALDGIDAPSRKAEEITAAAVNRTCPLSVSALDMFCAMLGSFAGDMALAFGARGGVFIAGGIAPRICGYLAASRFRLRFEAKGRLQTYLAAVPAYVITRKHPALLGLQALAERS